MSRTSTDASDDGRALVEIGVLVLEDLDPARRDVLDAALRSLRDALARRFDRFRWEFPQVERHAPLSSDRIDPGELLFEGVHERDLRHWDLALVVTASDLRSHLKPYALAVPSRSTGIAVVSLARVVGRHLAPDAAPDPARLVAVLAHVLGDLLGVPHSDDPEEFSFAPREIADLDRMVRFSPAAEARLEAELRDVADPRLEERGDFPDTSTAGFYLRAAWVGADDIARAIVGARPWALPFRLTRLTAAAAATTAVLTLTAEAWDLGLRQPVALSVVSAVVAVAAAAAFVLARQKLLLRRSSRVVSEQIVVMNVSIAAVVGLGIGATWALIWGVTLLVSWSTFDPELVVSWSPSIVPPVTFGHYAHFATFVATAGTLIGALGAGFEGTDLVRHVVFADEET